LTFQNARALLEWAPWIGIAGEGVQPQQSEGGIHMRKTTLSLAALAVAGLLLAAPAATQAMPKLDGLHQDSLVQSAAAAKKKKKKVIKKKKKKKYAKKSRKKKSVKKKKGM
jgi:hypothetical protein